MRHEFKVESLGTESRYEAQVLLVQSGTEAEGSAKGSCSEDFQVFANFSVRREAALFCMFYFFSLPSNPSVI